MLTAEATVSLSTLSDHDLIKEVLQGDRHSYGDLVRRYKNSLFDMACRILHSREDAEDVIQDSFVEAYRHLRDFNHRSKFSTWLYSIVLNRVRNRLRRRKTIRWHSLDEYPYQGVESTLRDIADHEPSHLVKLENKLEWHVIQEAISQLSMDHQTIFVLHYLHALPLQEVATRVGRPLGTVKVYLYRARQSLHKLLSEQEAFHCYLPTA